MRLREVTGVNNVSITSDSNSERIMQNVRRPTTDFARVVVVSSCRGLGRPTTATVSYTHLDVYKRQTIDSYRPIRNISQEYTQQVTIYVKCF